MSVWLPLIQRALLISGISGRDRCRDKIGWRSHLRLLIHTGAKQRLQITDSGCRWERGYKACIEPGHTSPHLAGSSTPPHQKPVPACLWRFQPIVAYACPLAYCLSLSLSPGKLYFITRSAVKSDTASVKFTRRNM